VREEKEGIAFRFGGSHVAVEWGSVRVQAACVHAWSAVARPGRGGTGSHNIGAVERREHGGEPGGSGQRNNASFELIQKFKLMGFDTIKRGPSGI
jgi:hypothetical protein